MLWLCRCDCGQERVISASNLQSGHTTSCGCEQRRATSDANATHRQSHTSEHNTWCWMKDRCCNPNNANYPHYGGRGIKICERWLNSFENFFADMGKRPAGCSIDRYPNNDGNYEPGNCRWATRSEQGRNRGRYNHPITAFGQTKLQTEWAQILNTSDSHIRFTLKRGKTIEWLAARRGIVIAA